ncbi:hypothetical protein [Nocardioides donggukensis]|uniref:LPXTG cell wall anchor domain-containing protein n=1 Tax=Nocardioides donggukensis TaxID=2774019 RepID=A0A927K2J3_9ACTN|nr:hypothetical protein [Nocardioides donggukensis]MBD8868293.1 hypothetical protein [Nocardioides donggukensis]
MSNSHLTRFIGKRATLVAIAASGVLVLGSAPVGANPADDVVGGLEDVIAGVSGSGGGTERSGTDSRRTEGRLPVKENDDPDREQADPRPPDHASAGNAGVEVADEQVADVGSTDATVRDDDSASGDATLLSLGGHEVIGAHAEGNESDSVGDPLAPLCAESDGALCAELLYANASSRERDGRQRGRGETGLADACIGGSAGSDDCSGPVGASALTSESEIERGRDGHTEAGSSSSAGTVCLVPDPETGCSAAARVLSSEGRSSSRGSSSKDTEVVGLELGDESVSFSDGPGAFGLPPECSDDPALACVFLEQGETYLGDGVAGHAVTALEATALDGTVLAEVSGSESLARKFPADPDGPNGPGGDSGVAPSGVSDGSQAGQVAAGGVLPNTGGVWTGFLALALGGVGLGSLLVAWSRRSALTGVAGVADGSA